MEKQSYSLVLPEFFGEPDSPYCANKKPNIFLGMVPLACKCLLSLVMCRCVHGSHNHALCSTDILCLQKKGPRYHSGTFPLVTDNLWFLLIDRLNHQLRDPISKLTLDTPMYLGHYHYSLFFLHRMGINCPASLSSEGSF